MKGKGEFRMAKDGITIYDLLISCPGDLKDEIQTIKDVVDEFNKTIGIKHNIMITTKYWKTDSYPQLGGKAQEILNGQFVEDCDFAVACFWTRFGTPTDKYKSGTQEEIELLVNQGKQVFLYFFNYPPVSLSDIDLEQYNKVKKFQKEYENKGIYNVINNKNEFKTELLRHISLYCLNNLLPGSSPSVDKNSGKLSLCDYNTGERNKIKSEKGYWKEITDYIKELDEKNLKFFDAALSEVYKYKKNEPLFNKLYFGSSSSNTRVIQFEEKDKKIIRDYFQEKGVKIPDVFWDLGGLKYDSSRPYVNCVGGQAYTYKFADINNIYSNILAIKTYNSFLAEVKNKKVVKCMLTNSGNTYYEGIRLRISSQRAGILNPRLPRPHVKIIPEYVTQDFLVMSYPYFESSKFILASDTSNTIEQLDLKSGCYRLMDYYTSYTENGMIILDIPQIKPKASVCFPTVLIFDESTDFFEYEIYSKNLDNCVTGRCFIV